MLLVIEEATGGWAVTVLIQENHGYVDREYQKTKEEW